MRKINYLLIMIAILGIVFAFFLFSKEGIAIDVNSKNKEFVYQSLNGEIENPDNVTKIILGEGWNSGKLTIYHSFRKKETLYITDSIVYSGIFSMITGVIWSVAGDIGGSEYSSTATGILDWSVYMGAAIQAFIFGLVKDTFGWSAIFITIGCLYIVILALTIVSSRIKECE